MKRRSSKPIPQPITELQRQLDYFRSNQPRRARLPEELWQAAVDLARQHGVYPVAHTLRLDYVGLKKRLGGSAPPRRKVKRPAFIELVAPRPALPPECVIEFESASGSKMRIQWKAATPPDWSSLLRAWRETAG